MEGVPDSHGPSEPNMFLVVLSQGLNFVQTYGWTMVFCVVSFYVLRPHVLAVLAKRQQAASLAFANEPNRRRVLDDDLRRVRLAQLRQQQEASQQKKAEELRKKREEEQAAKKEEESGVDDESKPQPSRPSSDNPWADLQASQASSVAPAPRVRSRRPEGGYRPMDGGGGGGYRPRRITPRRG